MSNFSQGCAYFQICLSIFTSGILTLYKQMISIPETLQIVVLQKYPSDKI